MISQVADVAELVDARDLKAFVVTYNHLKSQHFVAKHHCSAPAETDANPPRLQNISDFGFPVNKVRARGRRYAYIRGTNIALVRGFVGSDEAFDAAILSAAARHSSAANAKVEGFRMDAAKLLHKGTKARAARKGLSYELGEEAIVALLGAAGDACEVTGLQFDYRDKSEAKWLRRPMAPSIDRKDNTKGYTPDNIRMVCVCVNIAINEWGLENFEQVCRAFARKGDLA